MDHPRGARSAGPVRAPQCEQSSMDPAPLMVENDQPTIARADFKSMGSAT